MIFPKISQQFPRVRALAAGTFFLLIHPQQIHSFDPFSLTDVGTLSAVLGGAVAGGQLLTYVTRKIFCASDAPKEKMCAPNCPQCLLEKGLPTVTTSEIRTAPHATHVTYNHNTTTNTTTITTAGGSTINVVTPKDVLPDATPIKQSVNVFQNVQQPKGAAPVVQAPCKPNVQESSGIYGTLNNAYQNHYGKLIFSAAGIGYAYMLYFVSRLQSYLTDKKRVGLWFGQYDLNKLLLLETDQMNDLLVQEFVTQYCVTDAKNLKTAITAFLNDIETELDCLQRYCTITARLDSVSSVTQSICSPCTSMARALIPLAGTVLDALPVPGISSLFFIDNTLKNSIPERISRIHYYKNIFLQSTIVI